MNITPLAPPADSSLGSVPGGLCLRVVGAGTNGPLVTLAAPKCTIGSEPNCTLRIRGRGLDPVSCLVLRGSRGMAVRNWSGRAQLNGKWFADSPLNLGDRLDLGGIEFEVVAPPMGPAPRSLVETLAEETSEQLSRLLDVTEKLETERSRTAVEKTELRKEQDTLVAELTRLNTERAVWEARLAEEQQALAAKSAQWEQEQAAWNQRRQAEIQECTVERNELTRRFTDLTIRADELSLQREELKQRQQELEAREKELERQRAGLAIAEEQLRAETARQLDAQIDARDEFCTRGEEVDANRTALEQQRLDWERESAEARKALAAEREALNSARDAIDIERNRLERNARDLAEKETACNALAESLSARGQELDQLLADRSASDHLLGELEERRKAMEADYQRRHAELDSNGTEVAEQQQSLESQRARLIEREELLNQQQAENEQTRTECEARLQNITERTAQLSATEAEIESRLQAITLREESFNAAKATLLADQAALESQRGELTERAQQLEQLTAETNSRQREYETDSAKLAELEGYRIQLESRNAQLEQLQHELSDRDQSLAKLHESISQLEQIVAQRQEAPCADSNAAAESEALSLLSQKLEQRQSDLDHHQRVIDQQRLDLEARLEQEGVARREWELQTAEGKAALEAGHRELEAAHAQLHSKQEQLAGEKRQLDAQLAELAAEREQFAACRKVAEPQTPASDSTDLAGDAQAESADTDDHILDRLIRITQGGSEEGIGHDENASSNSDSVSECSKDQPQDLANNENADDDVQVSDAFARFKQQVSQEESAATTASVAPKPAPTTASNEEESIEDYMARLMQRVRGEAAADERTPADSSPRQRTRQKTDSEQVQLAAETEAPDATTAAAAPILQVPDEPAGPVELVARAQAPEKNELSRMRELANLQARAAIDKSMRSRKAHENANKWGIVGVGAVMSAAMGYMGWQGNRMALLGMCAGLAVSIYYALHASWSAKDLLAHRSGEKK